MVAHLCEFSHGVEEKFSEKMSCHIQRKSEPSTCEVYMEMVFFMCCVTPRESWGQILLVPMRHQTLAQGIPPIANLV